VAGTAVPNQIAYDDLEKIERAITSLKDRIPKKARHPRLAKQLKRTSVAISEVPENLDMLSDKGKAEAASTLDQMSSLLGDAAEGDKIPQKRQEVVGKKLRKLRKDLDRIIGK
jgi:hypothetical protein